MNTFINPLCGLLITLEDTAQLFFVCLSLCVQTHIKILGSAGYHGVSSLLSAHFSLADFSCVFFLSSSFALSVFFSSSGFLVEFF